jgi:hypothetical protein
MSYDELHLCLGTNLDQQHNVLQQMERQYLDRNIYFGIKRAHVDLSDNWDTIEMLGQEYHLVGDEQPKLVK